MTKIWLTPWSNLLQKVHSQMTNLWLRLDQVFLVKVLSAVIALYSCQKYKMSVGDGSLTFSDFVTHVFKVSCTVLKPSGLPALRVKKRVPKQYTRGTIVCRFMCISHWANKQSLISIRLKKNTTQEKVEKISSWARWAGSQIDWTDPAPQLDTIILGNEQELVQSNKYNGNDPWKMRTLSS